MSSLKRRIEYRLPHQIEKSEKAVFLSQCIWKKWVKEGREEDGETHS